VKAQVEEVGGDVHKAGPCHRVGADQGDFLAAQEADEFRADEAGVANFDGVTQRTGG
jgi:hypothetical protein